MQPFTYMYRTNPHDTISKGDAITGHNVVAYLDNGAKNTIVLGAHYDNLGFNEHNNSTKANSKG